MAECVSCGKEIPAGKFFCDECYVKMKGQRGMLKKVPPTSAAKPDVRVKPPEEKGAEEKTAEQIVPAGVLPDRKASGTLTPAAGKKVVSLKPTADKAAKEREGKKRFTVTITFSERTYAALARMKKRKEPRPSAEGSDKATAPHAGEGRPKRSKGPHGRPKLKAVVDAKKQVDEHRSGFMGVIAYRDRKLDRRDLVAAATASFAVLMIVVLCSSSWARVSWGGGGEAASMQTVKIKGFDLGAMTYICIAVVSIAYLYMVATWVFKGPFTKIDYGVILIVAGVIFIPLFFAAISSTSRLLSIALEKVGSSGDALPAQYERQTLWPAYIEVLMGAVLAFSGLVRLSERRRTVGADDR
ncbi:MAG: hypothetical protein JW854_06420 [Actinobacteria bacterium]|nr:hypothetical protein [Actinomycetota bacterium]